MFRLAVVDGDGRASGRVRPRRPGVMPDGDLRAHLARFRCFHWQPTSGNAFARAALERVLPVPEEDYRISADAYLASVVPLFGTVRSTDAVLGSYRVHARSNFTSVGVDDAYSAASCSARSPTTRTPCAWPRPPGSRCPRTWTPRPTSPS